MANGKIKKRVGLTMFGHHVALLYNKIELEFAIGGDGEAPFLKVVCSNGVKRVSYQRPWRL